jgi:plasmid maintenance system killer protein
MLIFKEFYENEEIKNFLIKRRLLKQYLKSITLLKKWFYWKMDFKERQPKWIWVYSFRINKQFRAIWYFDSEKDFIVVKIDNHQN